MEKTFRVRGLVTGFMGCMSVGFEAWGMGSIGCMSLGSGFGVWGLGFGVWGLRFGV